jgi:hypothetical protein
VVTSVLISAVYAKPHSVLGKLLGYWGKKPEILLAIKRNLDNDAVVIVFDGKKVKAYKFPRKGSMEEMKPLLTYDDIEKLKQDIEKLKQIKADAGWAHKKFMEFELMKEKEPLVRGVQLHIDADGNLKFRVHIYSSTNDYRGAWSVDAKTWKFDKEKVSPPPANPMQEVWVVPLDGEKETAGKPVAKGPPQEQDPEAAEGRGAGEGRRGGRRGGRRQQ